jgi:hypothetical protein
MRSSFRADAVFLSRDSGRSESCESITATPIYGIHVADERPAALHEKRTDALGTPVASFQKSASTSQIQGQCRFAVTSIQLDADTAIEADFDATPTMTAASFRSSPL